MKKIILIILFCCITAACSPEKPSKPITTQKPELLSYDRFFESIPDIEDNYIPALNTMVKLRMFESENTTNNTIKNLDPIVIKYHKLLDNYHYYRDDNDNLINNIKILNDNYGSNKFIELDNDLINLLKTSIQLSKETDGYFNPFIGSLTNLYDGKFSPFPVKNNDPTPDSVNKALACVVPLEEIDNILSFNENKVMFNTLKGCEDKVSINLGAISKGYITDILKNELDSINKDYLLDIGSSNIIGKSTNGYKVGVRSPYNKVSSIFAINLPSDICLSSSGDDNNYYILESDPSIIRSHILDPYTGYSNNYYRSVTVLSSSSMLSDCLSTTLFNIQDEQEILRLINKFETNYNTNIEVALIKETNQELQQCELIITKGMNPYLIEGYTIDNITSIRTLGD